MKEYILSIEIKFMFIFNVMLFLFGMIFSVNIIAMGSVIIFVILSVSIQILEAIHLINKGK